MCVYVCMLYGSFPCLFQLYELALQLIRAGRRTSATRAAPRGVNPISCAYTYTYTYTIYLYTASIYTLPLACISFTNSRSS